MASALSLPPINVHALLRSYQLEPKKSLGQNFLVDPTALERIVQAAEISPDAEVLEVGPGLGSLTRYLAQAARRVVAVELDTRFIPALEEVLAGKENIVVVQGDILKLDPTRLMEQEGYQVVANIPYYITSALIRHLLEANRKPSRMVLTIQKEVAQRITAAPGDMSLLALSVQVYGLPRQVLRIPAGAFYPPPKVDSEVVRIDLYPQPVIPIQELDAFFFLIKAGFSQKRKTLRNSVSAGLRWKPEQAETLLRSSDVDPQRRAETLSLEEWKKITHEYIHGFPQK
jgi:16S rRNA (adenine1518-N6/adenine1519-N6)-dimethyltransferase